MSAIFNEQAVMYAKKIANASSAVQATAVSATASVNAFNILEVPFYRAISLFEAAKFQESIPLFLELTQKYNLYAAFYLNYLHQNAEKLGLKIEEEKKAIAEALKYFPLIPRSFGPDAWLKASLLIIQLKNADAAKDQTQVRNVLLELKSLTEDPNCTASNGLIAFFNYNNEKKVLEDKPALCIIQKKFQGTTVIHRLDLQCTDTQWNLLKKADLLAVFYTAQWGLLSDANLQHAQEWAFAKKFDKLINNSNALIEAMIARSYNGAVTDIIEKPGTLTKTQKKSSFEKDLFRKFKWEVTAAYMGCSERQLSFSMESADSIPENDKKLWLFWAALNNDAQAQVLMGNIFLHGTSQFSKSLSTAKEFYQRGLSQRKKANFQVYPELLAVSLYEMGYLEEHGTDQSPPNDINALKYFQEAAALEYSDAYFNVGVFYANGRGGLDINFAKAVEYYQKFRLTFKKNCSKAEKTEKAKVAYMIACLYHIGGYGLTQDFAKAADYARAAVKYSDGAKELYGSMLYLGQGVPQNTKIALGLLISSAKAGFKYSANIVLSAFFDTALVPKDFGITEEEIEKIFMFLLPDISNQSNKHAKTGRFYLAIKNYDKTKVCLDAGEKLKEAGSLYFLGYLFERGCPELKIPLDDKKALDYYDRAAKLGNKTALSNKGVFLEQGKGTAKNLSLAKECYEMALGMGDLGAAYNLSCMYRRGLGVTTDYNTGFNLLLKSDQQDRDVLYNIALCYDRGEGTEIDIPKAIDYIKKAADLKHEFACVDYARYLLKTHLDKNGTLDHTTVSEILEYIDIPFNAGRATAIYFKIILLLLVDDKQKENVKTMLEEAQKNKPYHKYRLTLELLNQPDDDQTREKLLLLLCIPTISSIDDLNKAMLGQRPTGAPTDEPKTNLANASAVSRKAPATSTATALDVVAANPNNLAKKLGEITNALNNFLAQGIKLMTFPKLGKIFKQVTALSDLIEDGSSQVIGKTSSSKGSNIKFRATIAKKELRLSYHPTHGANRKKDGGLDRNRNQSVKKFSEDLKSSLESLNSKTAYSAAGISTRVNTVTVASTATAAAGTATAALSASTASGNVTDTANKSAKKPGKSLAKPK